MYSRQLGEENAFDEMEIAENGPEFVHADNVIRKSMDKYWRSIGNGSWHFCYNSDDIRTIIDVFKA